jgi:F420H(2)-dependent quinone reductase
MDRPAMRTLHLRTVGRRTGAARRTPLYYVEDGRNLAVITSNAGRDREPAWWLNLQAHPDATVELPDGPRDVTARAATGEERARL